MAEPPFEEGLARVLRFRLSLSSDAWAQVNGHYMAKLDPLGLDERKMPIELDPALYGFADKDLDRECAYAPPPGLLLVRAFSHPSIGCPQAACEWLHARVQSLRTY